MNRIKAILTALLILSAMAGAAAADLPATWDWRDVDGVNYVTPVKHQGACGACGAFSAVGATELYVTTHGGPMLDLSEEQAKMCGGHGCSGGLPESMLSLFSIIGSVSEEDDPYTQYVTTCNQNTPVVRVTGWKEPADDDRDAIKACVYEYGQASVITGSHALVLVGWNDTLENWGETGCWILKDSRGVYTPTNGFRYYPYDWTPSMHGVKSITGVEYHDPDMKTVTNVALGGNFGAGYHPNNSAWGMSLLEVDAGEAITRIEFDTTGSTSDIDFYIYDGYDGTNLGTLLYQSHDMSHDMPGMYSVNVSPQLVLGADTEVAVVGYFVNTGTQHNLNGFRPVAIEIMGENCGKTYVSQTGESGTWTPGENFGSGGDVSFRLRVAKAIGGDINYDHEVDVDDLILLGQAWGTYPGEPGYHPAADINSDGEIDEDDLILLGQNWTG